MDEHSGWVKLREMVLALPAVGEAGFEGLVTRLLSAETGSRFYLARSGDQKSGDSISTLAGVSVQTKLYTSTRISENNVEGEIRGLLAENPQVDLYFLASTSSTPTAQLKTRLERIEQETGLDIIFEVLAEIASPLGAMLAKHFAKVADFFPEIETGMLEWIREMENSERCISQLNLLAESLRRRQSFDLTLEAANNRRRKQFEEFKSSGGVPLSDLIQRESIFRELEDWWCGRQSDRIESPRGHGETAVLAGEEGTGKSWAAAAFADAVSTSKIVVTFWLDSLEWCELRSVESVVRSALGSLRHSSKTSSFVDKLWNKVRDRWDRPILIVLDGANERGASVAAEHIIADYKNSNENLRDRVKILFTTRRNEISFGAGKRIWTSSQVTEVGEFSDPEFELALENYGAGIRRSDIAESLVPLAKIPRYFHLSLQLRDSLRGIKNVTKEILLFAELESKLNAGDPQLHGIAQSLGGSPVEILASLAEHTGTLEDERYVIPIGSLAETIPAFSEARNDLIEQRVVTSSTPTQVGISKDHIVVGWALILLRIASGQEDDDIEIAWDRVMEALEPASSNDWKAASVYTALLISVIKKDEYSDAVRAILLLSSVRHHNSPPLSSEVLEFLAGDFLVSYVSMVEAMFRDHSGGGRESRLIAPLAKIWRDNTKGASELKPVLGRWLRMIYPGNAAGSKSGTDDPPEEFVPAICQEQLALSFAAISILSFRPAEEMIPHLFAFHRSTDFCFDGSESHRYTLKDVTGSFAVLLRWHYGEPFVRHLEKRATERNRSDEERKSDWWLARLLRLATLPESIGEARDIIQRSGSTQEHYRLLKAYLNEGGDRNPLGHGVLDSVPLRDSFEKFSYEEVAELRQKLAAGVKVIASSTDFPNAWQLKETEGLLPFSARYDHDGFHEAVAHLWRAALGMTDPEGLIMSIDDWIPGRPSVELVAEILAAAPRIFGQRQEIAALRLTFLVALFGSGDQQIEWFEQALQLVPNRVDGTIVSLLPIGQQLSLLGNDRLGHHAHARIDELLSAEEELSSSAKAELRHWLVIFHHTKPSAESKFSHLALANRFSGDSELALGLLRCGLPTVDRDSYVETLRHPLFKNTQIGFQAWHWLHAFPDGWPAFDVEEILEHASLTVAGMIFAKTDDCIGLERWGELLFQQITLLLEEEARLESDVQFEIDSEGRFAGTGPVYPPDGSEKQFARDSNAWGVDRESKTPTPSEDEFQEHFDRYRAGEQAKRSDIQKELRNFNGRPELLEWAKRQPEKFSEHAVSFFDKVEKLDLPSHPTWEFVVLFDSVKLAYLYASPKDAVERFFRSSDDADVLSRNGGNWACHAIWDRNLDEVSEVRNLREKWVFDATNDETLLWLACGAIRHGNEASLSELAVPMLSSQLARERGLGITLTALLCSEGATARMKEIADQDVSFWMREHAQWAFDFCETESAVQSHLERVSSAASVSEAARLLGMIAPSLTPISLARSARLDFRDGENARKIQALLEAFWHNYRSSSKSSTNIEMGRRKLREYCRGQKLKDGETSRMAPWWKID